MAQYTQRAQPMHRAGVGQTPEHGALAYGAKPPPPTPSGAAVPPRPPASAAGAYPPAQPYPHPPVRLQPSYTLPYRDSGYARGGDYGRAGGGGGRISLLPGGYLAPPPTQPDPPPKKARLAADRPPPHHQQLRIETREPISCYNTVELLSPNPPNEPQSEATANRTTKDDLLQQIARVDRDVSLSEQMLAKLKRKQEELQRASSQPPPSEDAEPDAPRHRCLAQAVLADNRKKAERAVAALAALKCAEQNEKWPLYNQPQDTDIYHANKLRHAAFRPRLVEYLRRAKRERDAKRQACADAYAARAAAWARRVERIEQGQKRKAKEARNREFFEKVFPELRKQREDRERFNRVGARVKSEADMEEIVDGLQEQELEEKKMRSLAVVPPLHCASTAAPVYTDTNGLCGDMELAHKELAHMNVWTPQERELFKEKYLQHPKNFGAIASFFTRKSVRDCVRFYYLTKKTENYKQLLRKSRQRRSARNPARNPAVPAPDLPPGVTTRQRAQGGAGSRGVEKDGGSEFGAGLSVQLTCIPVPAESVPLPPSLEVTCEVPLPNSPPPRSPSPAKSSPAPAGGASSPPAAVTSISSPSTPKVASPHPAPPETPSECPAAPASTPAAAPASPLPATTALAATSASLVTSLSAAAPTVTVPSPAPPTPPPAVPTPPSSSPSIQQQQQQLQQPPPENGVPESAAPCEPEPGEARGEARGETAPEGVSGGGACCVCGEAGTRAVPQSRAHYYGLRDEAAAAGARVCESCHCKCVRSRLTRCPVPTCPGPKVRAKRLRHLPPRWHDLPLHVKQPVCDEFQIPNDLSKCCLACLKRITRRIESEGDGAGEPSEGEAARFRTLLRDHGTDWTAMSAAAQRSVPHLKAFYFSYRKRFSLDALVERERRDRTSDEDDTATSCDTDTASAESPRPPPPPDPAPKPRVLSHPADPYDSSATETADEENETPARHSPKHHPPPPPAPPPPAPHRNGPATPAPNSNITVNDIVLNVVEYSMFKTSTPSSVGAKPPPPVTIKATECRVPPREALATLSVVNAQHNTSAPPRSPQRQATITPVAPPSQDAPKDSVVVVQLDGRRAADQEPLLDLSVKRPRDRAFPAPAPAKPPAPLLYRGAAEFAYRPAPDRDSPSLYQLHAQAPKPTKGPPPRPAPKPPLNPKGSITHGTPVDSNAASPRFDAPRRTPPDTKVGSITAGTPVHAPHHLSEKRAYEYYTQRRSPAGAPYYASGPRAPSPHALPNAAYSRGPYGLEQRQIIMADYITSQKMHGTARRGGDGRAPSPQYSPGVQRREGVIQRHTPAPQHPQHQQHQQQHYQQLPPDAAVAAQSLPVPRATDKQTNVDNKAGHARAHAAHELRMQDRMHRDMAQKFQQHQQIQYQAMERERRQQHAQYVDRQIAMQQGRDRDRERALAAMQQERQIMEHQQHLHDARHHLPHPTQVGTSEERRQLSAAPTYSTARHLPTQHPHHLDRKDSRVVVSSSSGGAAGGGAAGAGGAAPPQPPEGKLTAASIIDAIIMHQINQTASEPAPRQDNTRTIQLQSLMPRQETEGGGAGAACGAGSESGAGAGPGGGTRTDPTPQGTTSFKLGDLASNIITRDFCSPTTHMYSRFGEAGRAPTSSAPSESGGGGGAGGGGAPSAGDEWKRARDTAPAKHVPFLEPVSPPDNHHHINRAGGANRRYGASSSTLTAYDYVANRIVEVMRGGEEKPAAAPAPPPVVTSFTPAPFYPFSVLNVATTDAPPAPSHPAPPPPAPEPAPLMSAQYEPLSDED